MIPSLVEIAAGIYGAWRLARRDVGAMVLFDTSVAGFWKSFFAAVLIAPAYVLLASLSYGENPPEAPVSRIVLVELGTYVISWVAFPVIMATVAQAIDRQARYIGFIVALNWAQVIAVGAVLPVALLQGLGLLPDALAGLLHLAIVGWVLYYLWFIARTALDVSGWMAAGLVALAFFIDLLLDSIAIGMLT